MPNASVLIPRARSLTTGQDGIPDYVSAVKGDPRKWVPAPGWRLEVRCDGTLLRYVLEADRRHDWAVCKAMIAHPDGFREVSGREVFYSGQITFRLRRVERVQ